MPAEHALFLVDFSNAFDTMDRFAMLRAIPDGCPHFLPYAVFCDGAPTPLSGPGGCFSSQSGTQQEDVCGPPFFAVTAHAVAQRAAQAPGSLVPRSPIADPSDINVECSAMCNAKKKERKGGPQCSRPSTMVPRQAQPLVWPRPLKSWSLLRRPLSSRLTRATGRPPLVFLRHEVRAGDQAADRQ